VRILLNRIKLDIRVLIGAYALLLLIGILVLPLRIEELLRVLVSQQHSLANFIAWLPKAPGSSPLYYFVQFPFLLALGVSRLGARVPSLLLGVIACYLFLRLVKNVRLRHPYLAAVTFVLIPAQYRAATQGQPFELALCLLLVATLLFLQIIRTPRIPLCAWYAAALTLCLYTERFSFLPSIGYLLFLFAFVNRSHERRVIWFLLPSTVAPVLLFAPYYLWARPQASPNWLTAPLPPGTPSSVYLQAVSDFAGGGATGYVLSLLLIAGLFAGVWGLFRLTPGAPPALPRSIAVFCLFGGALSTVSVVLVVDAWNRYQFLANQVLWAIPAVIVSSFVAFERYAAAPKRKFSTAAAACLLIALSLIADAQYVLTPLEDLYAETRLIPPELRGDSCVVFVSQRLSKNLFLLLDPGLQSHECSNFFHRRAVLASHAYVTPFQQEDAESFFRGLNFVEVKRIRAGGGQIVVMETPTGYTGTTQH
jgi:hypothetical protein